MNAAERSRRRFGLLTLGCCLVAICALSAAIVGLGAGASMLWQRRQPTPSVTALVETPPPSPAASSRPADAGAVPPTPPSPMPWAIGTPMAPDATLSFESLPSRISTQPAPPAAFALLDALGRADYPPQDYFESARRLGARPPGPRTTAASAHQPGDRRRFVTDSGETWALLVLVTEHMAVWVEDGLDIDEAALAEAVRRFETDYYTTLTRLFGTPWQPGMDGDPRFHVLHLARFADDTELGYFDASDEYPRSIVEASNEAEIVYLNMSQLDPGEDIYFGTLAHEVMHLTQWHRDANETTWLDEGLAQAAELVLGLETVDTHVDWLAMPDVQLNRWEASEKVVYAHYGAAFLLAVYVWEQLGLEALQALFHQPANGLEAVEAVLAEWRPGLPLSAFLSAWAVANLLDGTSEQPAHNYAALALDQPLRRGVWKRLPATTTDRLAQYGVHYVELSRGGPVTITFAGDTLVPVTDGPPPTGEPFWLAPAVDNLAATLTREVDLRGVAAATLEFWAWFDLEEGWDYAYLTASTDGGESWTILAPDHAVAGLFGPAYGGRSARAANDRAGWVFESVSLDALGGTEAILRFEVLTDATQREGGFAVAGLRIGGVDPPDGVGDDLWVPAGFVTGGASLPQRWSLQLVQREAPYAIQTLVLDERNQGRWQVELSRRGATLIIMPQTPFTGVLADYWLQVEP